MKDQETFFGNEAYIFHCSNIRVKDSVTALLESLTALLEYLNLLRCLQKSVSLLGHVHAYQ